MSAATSRTAPVSISGGHGETMGDAEDLALRLEVLATQVEAGFRDAAALAVSEAHGAGVAAAVLDGTERPAWLHPDGTVQSASVRHPWCSFR